MNFGKAAELALYWFYESTWKDDKKNGLQLDFAFNKNFLAYIIYFCDSLVAYWSY